MLRFSHDERLTGSARQREPISTDVSIYFFKAVQFQMFTASNNSVWLCASAAQTGRVSACVCVWVFVWWLCANVWQRRETERDPQTKTFHGWQRRTSQIIHLRVNLFKSHLTARVRSHYCCRCCCWWCKMMQNTSKCCLWFTSAAFIPHPPQFSVPLSASLVSL